MKSNYRLSTVVCPLTKNPDDATDEYRLGLNSLLQKNTNENFRR